MIHEKFISEAELLLEAVSAANRGWTFELDYGERKFKSGRIIARKNGIEKVFYESSDMYDILYQLKEIDYPEDQTWLPSSSC